MTAREEVAALMATAPAQGGMCAEPQRLRLCELIPLERREEEQAGRNTALALCSFTVGDRVLHKSGGSAERGADARVGIVRRVYTVAKTTRTAHTFVAKLSVDWPAPRRIGGDGWHRSDVLASAVIPATDEEIERRRAINRAIVARRTQPAPCGGG